MASSIAEELPADAPAITFPFTFISELKVLFPENVWAPVVIIPPLIESAGARFNTPVVMVAPFVFEVEFIAPTVTVASLPFVPVIP